MTACSNPHPDLMLDEWLIWTYAYWNIDSFVVFYRGYQDYRPCVVDDLNDDQFRYEYRDYMEN